MRNLTKWHCQLTEYDIKYVSRTSVEGQAIADHLAKFPINYDTPINSDFPDERILQLNDDEESPRWKMYFDGTINSIGSAEYEACILGLQAAVDLKVKEIEVFGDSMPTIFQMFKQWKTKDPKLVSYREYLEELVENFEKVSFTITKENLIEPLEFEIAQAPAHCNVIDVVDGKPWYANIKHLLQTGQFSAFTYRHDRRTLRFITTNFFLSGETLYRRSFDATLLLCVDENEAQRLMEEIKAKPNELHSIAAPWPFSMWGMGVIGPINPKASNGHLFILVAIDHFAKWIEAITLASVTAKAVARFLKRDIITRYGVPATLITDNAKNLNNKLIDELCAQFKIQHRNSYPYRPQMNSAVAAANNNIKKIIEEMMVNYKDWHEMLLFALLAYRTSIQSSTGATPYSLVHGMEAVLPIEVEIPSMRVLAEFKLKEVEWAKQHYEQLNFIDEKRLIALCHGQCYQQRMANHSIRESIPRVRPWQPRFVESLAHRPRFQRQIRIQIRWSLHRQGSL
ncbi:hypothetical protein CRG98_028900 [Punica granatum]|uniref:Integrase catalytic domain-containing protein n=1 Tax=Punica granatum TaxID=22663 RepID=A0A2I0J3F0_PUNGR|nr:hypothetical protein CRG98_028900 [Punica granatum]